MTRRNSRDRDDRTDRRVRDLERRLRSGHFDRDSVVELARLYERSGVKGVTKDDVIAWLEKNRVGLVEAVHRTLEDDNEDDDVYYTGGGDTENAEDEVYYVIRSIGSMTRSDEIAGKNRQNDMFFKHVEGDAVNAIFLPRGWVSETGEWTDDDETGEQHLVTRAWGPVHLRSNDADLEDWALTWPLETLAKCEEITEEEARRIHPALFEHLKRIADES